MLPDRIEQKIERVTESGCWIWTAHCGVNGYGRVRLNGRFLGAHRAVYELVNGSIGEGLQLDHLCRVRCCVNPHHLEPVECRENIRRGNGTAAKNMAATHCKRGHEFTDENTYYDYGRSHSGARQCRACNALRERARRVKRGLKGRIVKTHCPKGHPYDDANTYHSPSKKNRQCRECHKMHVRNNNAKRRGVGNG